MKNKTYFIHIISLNYLRIYRRIWMKIIDIIQILA